MPAIVAVMVVSPPAAGRICPLTVITSENAEGLTRSVATPAALASSGSRMMSLSLCLSAFSSCFSPSCSSACESWLWQDVSKAAGSNRASSQCLFMKCLFIRYLNSGYILLEKRRTSPLLILRQATPHPPGVGFAASGESEKCRGVNKKEFR